MEMLRRGSLTGEVCKLSEWIGSSGFRLGGFAGSGHPILYIPTMSV